MLLTERVNVNVLTPSWYRLFLNALMPMELSFADNGLQVIAESTVRSDRHWGQRDASLLRQRLCELIAADTLAVAATVPTLELKPIPSLTGAFAIRLRPRLRLILEIADPSVLPVSNGGVDLSKVNAIRILAIEESDES